VEIAPPGYTGMEKPANAQLQKLACLFYGGWKGEALQAAEKCSNAVILSAAKDPRSLREGRELSKLRGFFVRRLTDSE
jgi:hypothetical protein